MLLPVKITSKKSIGVNPVYDMQVENAHHYILENGIISHNSGPLFAASMVISMTPLKMKEDEDGVKGSDVLGIRAKCKVVKTRYNKPFESVEVRIPWEGGIDPYSGLFDLFEKQGLLVKEGNRYIYTDIAGAQKKYYRKEYLKNTDGILDLIMKEFDQDRLPVPVEDPTEDRVDLSDEDSTTLEGE
jgi:hypothetical protein